ncbi:unnamed protein product [Protopolystoma xenopodis]|uniref:Uncharacterized protein n=1 Tax=Protopolystoma xenopodis TaxID=117903 RepID=A0A3S5CKV5_9PLAT|nr:unnamed protein product [Protopolystoma xenopodis]
MLSYSNYVCCMTDDSSTSSPFSVSGTASSNQLQGMPKRNNLVVGGVAFYLVAVSFRYYNAGLASHLLLCLSIRHTLSNVPSHASSAILFVISSIGLVAVLTMLPLTDASD